ncbi:MAG: tripartite tricarboxylate transporter substrate binding protein [Betaproteobacteria bacterium]|nr:tripartite tricarboxylate transporter substrate binding protein [Betaproteobacteria bacterium]
MKTSACQLFGCGLAALAVAAAASAQPYPNKPVRLIVPYAPGGGTDILARLIVQKLTESLGQPVVIDNRAGADGIVGSSLVAKAPADGYTMLLASSSHAINPTVHAQIPYDTLKEFACVSQTASQQLVLVVHPSLPVNSVKELIAYAMANPDQLNFASSSKATQLPMELFNTMAGIRMTHIPYKGSGPALNDLVGGQVKVSFGGAVSFTPHIKSGRLRALAIGDAKRSAFMPDLPTAAEAGVPGYEATIWTGLYLPVATPKAIVTRLNAEVVKIMHQPELRERLQAQGSDPVGSSPEECDAFMKSEIAKWAKVAKDAGIKPEG